MSFVSLNTLVFFRVRVPVVFYLNMENTIGTISPFLFAINHRKCCSKRHLKNIILLNIDFLRVCMRACVRVCVLKNNKTTKE